MRNLLKYLLPVGLLAYIYYPTFVWMIDRWAAPDYYYAHGCLIPFISLYWIFKKGEALALCKTKNEPLGLAILIVGVLIQIASSILRIYFASAVALVLIIFGAVYFLFGKEVTKTLWFPIAFLLLMVPLPLLFISEVTLRMKFLVSEIAVSLLHSAGVRALREGSYIYTSHAVCVVGDPCSGLRSFLAFLCLGLVFAYGRRLVLWKKFVLVAAGLPLAIVTNVGRVFVMTLAGEIYGMDFAANHTVHDGTGILTFIFALFCFMVMRQKLEGVHAQAR